MTRTRIMARLPARADSTPQTLEMQALPGQKLSEAIWLSGRVGPRSLCAGLARCGRCRVRYLEQAPAPLACEEDLLGPEAVSQGWRLACRRQVPDMPEGEALALELPCGQEAAPGPAAQEAMPGQDGSRGQGALVLAVDLGTTTLCWQALAPDGAVAAEGQILNPQGGAGADVMSRLAFAASPVGRRRLSRLV
ncbi:MAG: FeS-binding protein, partial [Desulfovibrio sp.]|nr:FeS-binding protein [Desulfovibrio sp.]